MDTPPSCFHEIFFFTSKVQNDEMIVLESLVMDAPKTKTVVGMLNAFEAKKTLIVTAESNEAVYKSARNIEGDRLNYRAGTKT